MRPLTLAGLALWPLLAFAQNVVKVDDRDPSIQYSPPGAWATGGQGDEYLGTTTYSLTAYAQFSFSFHGVSVQVIGTPDTPTSGPAAGAFTYTVDGGAEQSGFAASGPRAPGTVLINLQNLANADHTLVVKNGGPAATKFVVDAIQYTTAATTTTEIVTMTTASTSTGASGAITVPVTLTVTQPPATTDTSTPNGTASGSSTPTTPVALIAGVTVGGVCGLGLLILLAVLIRRRCMHPPVIHDLHEPYMSSKTPEPGLLAHPGQPHNRPSQGWSPPPGSSHATQASSPPPPSNSPLSYDTTLFNYLDGPNVVPGAGVGGGPRTPMGGSPAMTPQVPPPGLPMGDAPPYNPYPGAPPASWNNQG